MAAAPVATDCPLTRLPAELLAIICDLVAESETRPVLCIKIEQDAATQLKTPRVSAFVSGLSGTCRQVRRDSSAALKRHVEVLTTHQNGNGLSCLTSAGELHHQMYRMKNGIVSKALQMHTSAAPETRHDEGPVHEVHALAAFIPIEEVPKTAWTRSRRVNVIGELTIVFVVETSKSEVSPSCLSLVIPPQSPIRGCDPPVPSLEAVEALNEVKQSVKGTQWAGNMPYYLLWFNYVVRYTQDLC
jgi:hypothetical protein